MPSSAPLTTIRHRKRRQHSGWQKRAGRIQRASVGLGAVLLLLLAALTVLAGFGYARVTRGLPAPEELARLLNPVDGVLREPTRLYDRSGTVLLRNLENPGVPRRYLSIEASRADSFSAELLRATTGILEPDFWRGSGVAWAHLTDPQPHTIAETLVERLFLQREAPDARRAARMRLLAAQITARYGHAQLMEWYLNSASYGHLTFGADSAAQLYLGKPASALNLSEAALLVAASQAPALNPLDTPESALQQQRAVLETLLLRGVIRQDEFVQAVLLPPRLDSAAALVQQDSPSPAEAFTRLVIEQLSDSIGRDRLEQGGLRIITTLDYSLQVQLTCLAQSQLKRLTGQPAARPPGGQDCSAANLLPTLPPGQQILPSSLTTSGVILDPQTGQVLALLGDTTIEGETAQITQRPPGSLLSPFVTLAALARGYGPASLVWDLPPGDGSVDAAVLQTNLEEYQGPLRLRMAVANDILAPQTELVQRFGPAVVWRLAATLGARSLAGETSADLLYQGGLTTPLEMAQAFGVLAASGQLAGQRSAPEAALEPGLALYVEDSSGAVLLDARQVETQSLVSPQLSYLTHHIYSDSVARRLSLGYPNPLEIGRPSAAKIGRVQNQSAVWAAGYTRQRVAVVWVGLPDSAQTPIGTRAAADLWHAAIQWSSRDLPMEDWPQSDGITSINVCDPSGLLPTPQCPNVVRELFLTGSEPTTSDTLYQNIQVNRETGRLATIFTPLERIEQQSYLVVPPQAQAWARAAGIAQPPDEYDAIQPPQPAPGVQINSPAMFAFVNEQTAIYGSAGGPGFQSYQLQVGQGINPQTWIEVGQGSATPVENGKLGEWNPGDAQGLYAIRLLVVRDDQSVETSTIQVTVDTTPPELSVLSPSPEEEITLDQRLVLPLRVQASDLLGLERVEWRLDGRLAGTRTAEPYTLLVEARAGQHVLEVRAYDRAGNVTRSAEIPFVIRFDDSDL